VIADCKQAAIIDGSPVKQFVASEAADRDWRADPVDGLRPFISKRGEFR
jgi:N-acetylneuraminate synthase